MNLAYVHDTVLCIKSSNISNVSNPEAWLMKGQTYIVAGHISIMGQYYYKLRDKPNYYACRIFTTLLTHELPEDLFRV